MDAGPTSIRDVAGAHYGAPAALLPDTFDPRAIVAGAPSPFFAAHGDHDDLVPYALGERLFDAARGAKRFVRVSGAGHDVLDDAVLASSVIDEISRFVRERLEIESAPVADS